jgi:peptidoglycan-associated lipoprotein
MKIQIFGMTVTAIGLLILTAGCAGQRSAANVDMSGAERVEDPFDHLPMASIQKAAKSPSTADAGHSGTFPAMLAFQSGSEASMFLFDIPFRFDRFTLMSDARAMVEVNAMRLKESDEQKRPLVLEGRCDEVGTSDYNLVLGERRAQAVREYLVNLGISSASIDIISYGKDRPICDEHNERCWAKNRTVHFVVR